MSEPEVKDLRQWRIVLPPESAEPNDGGWNAHLHLGGADVQCGVLVLTDKYGHLQFAYAPDAWLALHRTMP